MGNRPEEYFIQIIGDVLLFSTFCALKAICAIDKLYGIILSTSLGKRPALLSSQLSGSSIIRAIWCKHSGCGVESGW